MTALTGRPAYQQVAEDLRNKIRTGELSPGVQLPSTAQLMESYQVSSTVAKAAINQLRIDGLVIGQQGKGVFVRDPTDEQVTDAPHSQTFQELTQQLKAIRADMANLNERMTALEERAAQRRPGRQRGPRTDA